MPTNGFTPPKNPVRAARFFAGSSLVETGNRLMERFSDPEPPPEPILSPVAAEEPEPEENQGFRLELELACDPEVACADPLETITSQIVLNITAWRPGSLEPMPQARTRFEAYSDKLIHLSPYTISIERGRMATIDGQIPVEYKM